MLFGPKYMFSLDFLRYTIPIKRREFSMMFYWDPTYIILLPAILIAFWAQLRVKSAFARGSQLRSVRGMTGEQAARALLHANGIYDVKIESVRGQLTDHYDPSTRTLRLSDSVRRSDSIAAIGVACHEAGHAIQHAEHYGPLVLRTASVPAVNIGSNLAWPIFFLGLVFSWQPLVQAGIVLFSLVVLFSIVTLPVEFNASSRAIAGIEQNGILDLNEAREAKKVLSAAAMTYVASAITAVAQLLRLLAIAGVGRRRD